MNASEATVTNAIDINTLCGGHLRLVPGQYRVTPDRQGGAELVRIDSKQQSLFKKVRPSRKGAVLDTPGSVPEDATDGMSDNAPCELKGGRRIFASKHLRE
jgi:hypothetical protein